MSDQRLIYSGKLLSDHLHIKELFRQVCDKMLLHMDLVSVSHMNWNWWTSQVDCFPLWHCLNWSERLNWAALINFCLVSKLLQRIFMRLVHGFCVWSLTLVLFGELWHIAWKPINITGNHTVIRLQGQTQMFQNINIWSLSSLVDRKELDCFVM